MLDKILPVAAVLGFGVLYAVYQNRIYRDKDDHGPEMTGQATVKSHRVVQGHYLGKAPSRWNYLVTFTLSDGEEIELYTIQSDFQVLKDGTCGTLTWQGRRFLDFEADV